MGLRQVAIAGLMSLALLGGCRADDAEAGTAGGGGGARSIPLLEGDLAFIDGVVPRQQVAMFLADDALAHAHDPALRRYAAKLKAVRVTEIATMKARRAAWVGEDETPPVEAEPQATIPAGRDFDRRWAAVMLRQHTATIELAERALQEADRDETKAIAKALIIRERAEIQALRRIAPLPW